MRKNAVYILTAVLLTLSAGSMAACVQPKEDSGAYDNALKAYESGDLELAMSEFDKAIVNDKREAEGYRGQGIVYLKQQDYASAILMFDKSLESLKHDNEEFENDVLMYKAEACAKNADTNVALEIYSSLEESELAETVFALEGSIYLKNGDIQEAQNCFALSEEAGVSIETYLLIYEAFADVSLEGDGAVYLEKAKSIEPANSEETAELGKIYYYLDDYDNAVSLLNKAIEEGYTEAVTILGDIYLENDNISGAKDLFISAVNQNIDPAMAYNGLAMCAIKEGDYSGALSYITTGLGYDDNAAKQSLLFNEIIVYEKMLDFETAKAKMNEFLILYPDDERALEEAKFILR
jgi:tetratricopeptide (TPR) repeat protein